MNVHMNKETPAIPFPLRCELLVDAAPPADLWARIETAHRSRVARRRTRRIGGVALTCAAAGVLAFGYLQFRPATHDVVDWQARAEALELQLQVLQRDAVVGANTAHGASEVESELGALDRSLQTAYEGGASANELASLWKRRSELLDTLIVVRKQNLLLTRI